MDYFFVIERRSGRLYKLKEKDSPEMHIYHHGTTFWDLVYPCSTVCTGPLNLRKNILWKWFMSLLNSRILSWLQRDHYIFKDKVYWIGFFSYSALWNEANFSVYFPNYSVINPLFVHTFLLIMLFFGLLMPGANVTKAASFAIISRNSQPACMLACLPARQWNCRLTK